MICTVGRLGTYHQFRSWKISPSLSLDPPSGFRQADGSFSGGLPTCVGNPCNMGLPNNPTVNASGQERLKLLSRTGMRWTTPSLFHSKVDWSHVMFHSTLSLSLYSLHMSRKPVFSLPCPNNLLLHGCCVIPHPHSVHLGRRDQVVTASLPASPAR